MQYFVWNEYKKVENNALFLFKYNRDFVISYNLWKKELKKGMSYIEMLLNLWIKYF